MASKIKLDGSGTAVSSATVIEFSSSGDAASGSPFIELPMESTTVNMAAMGVSEVDDAAGSARSASGLPEASLASIVTTTNEITPTNAACFTEILQSQAPLPPIVTARGPDWQSRLVTDAPLGGGSKHRQLDGLDLSHEPRRVIAEK
jgi:hypothetical protein